MADLPQETYKFEGFITGTGKNGILPGLALCSTETPVDPEFYEEHAQAGDIELKLTITRTVRENLMHQQVPSFSVAVAPAFAVGVIDELSRAREEEWKNFLRTCFKLAQGRFLDQFPQVLPPASSTECA